MNKYEFVQAFILYLGGLRVEPRGTFASCMFEKTASTARYSEASSIQMAETDRKSELKYK